MEKTKVSELISQARNLLRLNNADSTLSDRFIWSIIDKHIRWLLKRDGNKMKLMKYDTIFQTKKCVEVEEAPAIDSCCGVKSKCTVWRTKEKLPDIYEDESGVIVKTVYSIDGSHEIDPIRISEYMRKLENPDTLKYDKSSYFFYNNGYLYFPNISRDESRAALRVIMVKALFEKDVFNPCEDECATDCKSMQDNTVWIPRSMEGELMDFVKKDLLSAVQSPIDQQQDKDETRKN